VPERFHGRIEHAGCARGAGAQTAAKRVSFERTPKMSTYLFVLVAGELERLTGEAEGVTIGVCHPRAAKSANGRYAIDQTADLLKYFKRLLRCQISSGPSSTLSRLPQQQRERDGALGRHHVSSRAVCCTIPAKSSIETQRRVFSLPRAMKSPISGSATWSPRPGGNDLWLNEGFRKLDAIQGGRRCSIPEWQPWFNSNSAKQGRDGARCLDAGARRRHNAAGRQRDRSEGGVRHQSPTARVRQSWRMDREPIWARTSSATPMRRYMKEACLQQTQHPLISGMRSMRCPARQ